MRKIIMTFLSVFLIAGCASGFQKITASQITDKEPTNYEIKAKEYYKFKLFDYESARFEIGKPFKAYLNEGFAYGGKVEWSGWAVRVKVNAKNRLGGYTGYKDNIIFFKNDKAIKGLDAPNHVLLTTFEY